MFSHRLGRRAVTRGQGPPPSGLGGRPCPLGTQARPLLRPLPHGGGARFCPEARHAQLHNLSNSGLKQQMWNFYLVGDFSRPPQFLESEEWSFKDLSSLNDSRIFDNPLLGPSMAKEALPWYTSCRLLF